MQYKITSLQLSDYHCKKKPLKPKMKKHFVLFLSKKGIPVKQNSNNTLVSNNTFLFSFFFISKLCIASPDSISH